MLNEWQTIVGLVGLTLVVSGSNVLPQIREWCQEFDSPWQPLRWVGFCMEFAGIVTDKSMATGFVVGLLWWSGDRPWSEVVILSGWLTLAASVADGFLAVLYALLRKTMGGGAPSGPIPIPRRREQASDDAPKVDRQKKRGGLPLDRPLTEVEAFSVLDEDDDDADVNRGAAIRRNGEGA